MRNALRIHLACILCAALFCSISNAQEDANAPVFKTDKDRLSYVIGRQLATQIRRQKLNYSLLLKGLSDAVNQKKSVFTTQEEQEIMAIDKTWRLHLKKPKLMTFDANKDYFWILETNKGTIKIKFMPDVAPMHVTNAIYLTNLGFYNGLTFHRVIQGFMAQGGCPVGNGSGNPGYRFPGEFSPRVKHDRPFLLSTANAGPGTDGSQFFITFRAVPSLDGNYTIYGEVTEGQTVVKKLEAAGSRQDGVAPKEKLIIEEATIVESPKQ